MYFHHTHLINAAAPFPHLIIGPRPAAAMLDDSANCHAAKHAQTSIMPTPPYTIAVVQRGAHASPSEHFLSSNHLPVTTHTPVSFQFGLWRSREGGVVAFDDRTRNDAYNYSTSLSATDFGGDWWLAALRDSCACARHQAQHPCAIPEPFSNHAEAGDLTPTSTHDSVVDLPHC